MLLTIPHEIQTILPNSANTPARLGIGSAGQVLQVNSGGNAPEWASSSGVSAGFVIAMSVAL